ncbi:MAG TPA: DNA starvation/stationary phase protection protein [Gaiellaceae bacterium]|jgi:starvation-inducible DNA-binding protein
MSLTETQSHLPAIGEHAREEAGGLLQRTLVELIALALMGKQLHWNIAGPGFRELHLHLDELVDGWHGLSDTVAERAVAIGFPPDGRAPAVVAQSELDPVEPGPTRVPDAIRRLTERVAVVDERVRERAERLGDIDIASQDVLIEVTRALEKDLWMIRSSV